MRTTPVSFPTRNNNVDDQSNIGKQEEVKLCQRKYWQE
jgi:hypothetical protein